MSKGASISSLLFVVLPRDVSNNCFSVTNTSHLFSRTLIPAAQTFLHTPSFEEMGLADRQVPLPKAALARNSQELATTVQHSLPAEVGPGPVLSALSEPPGGWNHRFPPQ